MIFDKNVIELFAFNSNMIELSSTQNRFEKATPYKLTCVSLGHKFTVMLKQIIDVSTVQLVRSLVEL